jgi:2-octaprenyl-6-methoxyphenol hydroxylase
MQHETIVIVGGGPVGLVTALTLAKANKRVTLLDSKLDSFNPDGRVLALSYASYIQIENLGVIVGDFVTAIDKVHISHNGLGISNINARDVNLAHLGYTIKYIDLVKALYKKIREYPQIKLQKALVNDVLTNDSYATISYNQPDANNPDKLLTADLVILAEGGLVKQKNTKYKMHDYAQQAIVVKLKTHKPHDNIAYERFELDGPMVLLPSEDNYILVWALSNRLVQDLSNKDILLTKIVDLAFMKRFGTIELVSDISIFPLKLQVAQNRVLNRVVLIGNSSQTVHPISAQGLNLGLRDVRDLCEIVMHIDDFILGVDIINTYNHKRLLDVGFVSNFTHILAKFLDHQSPLMSLTRSLGLITLSNCKYLQNKLSRSLIFGV